MRNIDHKLQQWRQNLNQQVSEYDEYIKKLEIENKELDSKLSHMDHKLSQILAHFKGFSDSERATNMEARKEYLSRQKQTIEQNMSAVSNDGEKQQSVDYTNEAAMKDVASLTCYRMIGLSLLDTAESTHTIKSVSLDPPNVERFVLRDDIGDFNSAQKIWVSLGC